MATSVPEPLVWIVSSARRPGWVNSFGVPRACMVADLTHAGAILIFGTPTEVPAKFMLHLSGPEAYHCRVQTNDGLNVKVLFEPPTKGEFV